YAFEPVRSNCDLIEFNARLNGVSNITVIQAAVGDRTGTIRFAGPTTSVAFPGLEGDDVACVTLDQFLDKKPRFIKIDAEGYEGFVLKGAGHVLASAPNLSLEVDARSRERFGMTMADTVRLVEWSRYDCWYFESGQPTTRPWTPRTPVIDPMATWIVARRKTHEAWGHGIRRVWRRWSGG